MTRLALAAAVMGLAAVPATAAARPPEPPPMGCIVVSTQVFCVSDLPSAVSDPGGTVHRLVCYGDVRICES
jgi:hypothetical protein